METGALCLTQGRWRPARRGGRWRRSGRAFGRYLRNVRVFASVLISAGWSPAAVAIARLGGAAVLLTVPAEVQLRGRWARLRRESGRATGVVHVTANAGDVELLHRGVSWIVPVLELSLVAAVIA